MSHDFPDGPDYNPEPIDDDPWDTRPYAPDDAQEATDEPNSDEDSSDDT